MRLLKSTLSMMYLCAQDGAIGMSPQGMAGAGPQLQIVDSPFNGTTMIKPRDF